MTYSNTCPECKGHFLCKENTLSCTAKDCTNDCLCSKCYAKKVLGRAKLIFIKEKTKYRARFCFKDESMIMTVDCWLLTEKEKESFVLEVL